MHLINNKFPSRKADRIVVMVTNEKLSSFNTFAAVRSRNSPMMDDAKLEGLRRLVRSLHWFAASMVASSVATFATFGPAKIEERILGSRVRFHD